MNTKPLAVAALAGVAVLLLSSRKKAEPVPPMGPPPPPTPVEWPNVERIAQGWRVPAGWWWYWYTPFETAGVQTQLSTNAARVRIERAWGDDTAGYVVLFEVSGTGALWRLSRRPVPAPRGEDTDIPDLTQVPEGAEPPPSPFRKWIETVSGKAWQVLVDEWERLKLPPPHEPFKWPWED